MLPFPLEQPVVCLHLMLLGINNNLPPYNVLHCGLIYPSHHCKLFCSFSGNGNLIIISDNEFEMKEKMNFSAGIKGNHVHDKYFH